MTDIDTVHEDNIATMQEQLGQARACVAAADRALAKRVPAVRELHTAVDGAIRVTTTLAELVATLIRQAPATLDHAHQPVLRELLADLRAMHGCLTTGSLLLDPARDDLHQLLTRQHTGPAILDDAVPAPDLADQQRPAHPEPTQDEQANEQALHGVGDVLDAAPADVADQRRAAPVLDEDEPWP